jgi:hypothetical protein
MASSGATSIYDLQYAFRDAMVSAVQRDLSGPGEEYELIKDPPITKYIVGILYPQSGEALDPDEDGDLPDDDSEEFAPDPPVALSNVRYPSSMGVTFSIDMATKPSLRVSISAARYVPESIESENHQKSRTCWKRVPVEVPPLSIPPILTSGEHVAVAPGLQMYYRLRNTKTGQTAVTVVLLNVNRVPVESFGSRQPASSRDAMSFFQVGLTIRADESAPIFIERDRPEISIDDSDLNSYRLLYRNARSFAVGHGCGATWIEAEDGARAIEIASTFFPGHELLVSDTPPDIPVEKLAMVTLADCNWTESRTGLVQLCDGYAVWIDQQRKAADGFPIHLRATAEAHLVLCDEAVNRMRKGIAFLDGDQKGQRAFQLANLAMLQQRARTEWLKTNRKTPAPVEDATITWRPFQIAFILLCLEGLANVGSPERDIADLLWFPTGGGKTEAYLGLIAFIVFLTRLRRSGKAAGVTVLMRYTLRLLTIQQFERASLLIAACDQLRHQNEAELGKKRITIGLWVGQGATPNTRKDCRDALRALAQHKPLDSGNPMQLVKCVWCGALLDHANYWQRSGDMCLMVTCKQKDCDFGTGGLPVYLVDEDIYDFHPELIIGTVDKFAAMPWRAETAALFNRDNSELSPPQLIIQDELHLISGPLGTLTGLYETAVDALCTRDRVRPKVVASTATIRRANNQTQALFDREVRQFPPPALEAGNTYFAREAQREQRGTRMYVGAMAPGASHSTLMIRTYAALLQAAKDIPGADGSRDPYWTLLGYFNSLRVLGGAKLQVQDDVSDRLLYLADLLQTSARELEEPVELTSRVPSPEIPANLARIAVPFPKSNAVDVILATNMISVGVDVDRLGLMVVMGQPQATAEYIQATSRVGRRFPGLIFTLFNAARSRDRSHYESFTTYHRALYRQVESSSVTPFSPRARDRALHAILVALARLLGTKYRPNDSASKIEGLDRDVAKIKELILARARKLVGEDPDEILAIAGEVDGLVSRWKSEVEQNNALLFSAFKNPRQSLLVEAWEQHPDAATKFKTLRSLRDVDQTSDLYLVPLQ